MDSESAARRGEVSDRAGPRASEASARAALRREGGRGHRQAQCGRRYVEATAHAPRSACQSHLMCDFSMLSTPVSSAGVVCGQRIKQGAGHNHHQACEDGEHDVERGARGVRFTRLDLGARRRRLCMEVARAGEVDLGACRRGGHGKRASIESSSCSRRQGSASSCRSSGWCSSQRACVLLVLGGCWLACLPPPAAAAPAVYFAGTFAKFTTADGVEHNVTGVGEWSGGKVKPLGLGLGLPQVCLSICLCPSVRLSVCPSVFPSVRLRLSLSLFLSLSLSLSLSHPRAGLPQEATTLAYHPSPPECIRRCQNSQTCWTTCTPGTTPALYLGGSFTSANGEEIYRVTVARNRTMLEV